MAPNFGDWIKRLRSSFLLLTQAAIWVFAIIGGFLLPPPFGVATNQDRVWMRFAQFIVCIMIGFVFVVATRYGRKKDGLRWVGVAGALLILGTVSMFAYQYFRDAWTETLDGKRVLGGRYHPAVQDWVTIVQKGEATLPEVERSFGPFPDVIWTKQSRDKRRLLLGAMYIACVPLFTVCLISVLQAIYCVAPGHRIRLANIIPQPIVRPGREALRAQCRILFLAANPQGTSRLSLDEECRQIEEKIRAAEHRDELELVTRWAVRPDDLLQCLNQFRAHVVHFSGHGSPTEELTLVDDRGLAKPVAGCALKQLFSTLKDNIRLVVLNACFSRPQAEAITEVIDCAIGMNRAIGDRAAITFAASLYRAIGFGRSVQEAFDQGKTALLLEGIREENTPQLLLRHGLDAKDVYLIGAGRQRQINVLAGEARRPIGI